MLLLWLLLLSPPPLIGPWSSKPRSGFKTSIAQVSLRALLKKGLRKQRIQRRKEKKKREEKKKRRKEEEQEEEKKNKKKKRRREEESTARVKMVCPTMFQLSLDALEQHTYFSFVFCCRSSYKRYRSFIFAIKAISLVSLGIALQVSSRLAYEARSDGKVYTFSAVELFDAHSTRVTTTQQE